MEPLTPFSCEPEGFFSKKVAALFCRVEVYRLVLLLRCAAAFRAASMLSVPLAVFVLSGVGLLAPQAGCPTPPRVVTGAAAWDTAAASLPAGRGADRPGAFLKGRESRLLR